MIPESKSERHYSRDPFAQFFGIYQFFTAKWPVWADLQHSAMYAPEWMSPASPRINKQIQMTGLSRPTSNRGDTACIIDDLVKMCPRLFQG